MLVRRVATYAPRRAIVKHSQKWHIRSRPLSTAAPSSAPPQAQASPEALLATISTELDRRGPRIDLHADQVQVLYGPKEFYSTLKDKIRGARRRIFLATLYVGREEHELMDTIRAALTDNPHLQVSITTDALRGTRETPDTSCATLLASLAVDFPSQVEVRMYHTSNLTGLRKRLIPARINEGWGLQHMKIYGVDDEVILSGANLSRDYFTNRQDRYHVFHSAEVADYFFGVYRALRKLTWSIDPQNRPPFWNPSWPARSTRDAAAPEKTPQPEEDVPVPSPLAKRRVFDKATHAVFAPLLEPASTQSKPRRTDTSLYPLLILPRAQNTELPVLRYLLGLPYPRGSHYLFTAGYFNPHPDVTSSLISLSSPRSPTSDSPSSPNSSGIPGIVLTASPWANGFYGSKGVSGLLPAGYTLLARRFLQAAQRACAGAITLREWRLGTVGRPHGWTYHAKGLWLTVGNGVDPAPSGGDAAATSEQTSEKEVETDSKSTALVPAGVHGPSVTLLGSSNYTVRSYSLDTEAGAVLVTSDPALQRALRREAYNLLEHSRAVSEADLSGGERRVGPLVRLAMAAVRIAGGSL